MLGLSFDTDPAWVDSVRGHLDQLLIDHAHCERKAAGAAMNLLFSYVEYTDLVEPLREIIDEELLHLRMVLDILEARAIPYRRIRPSRYAGKLHALIRTEEPGRFVDRCLLGALIEARSCERFKLLATHLDDAPLRAFYADLLESEARHYMTYVRLAQRYAPEDTVRARLAELAQAEGAIAAEGDSVPRVHS